MAGRRYSAGRIFLDVIPSFRGVIRETEREVEKLRRGVEDDNAKAAEQDEKRQGKVRTRERTKAEKAANEAAQAERREAWAKMSREERRQAAIKERARIRDERLAARRELAGEVKKLDDIAKLNARALADREKARRKHEENVARIMQGIAVKAGQDMWRQVKDDEKKAQLEREKMRREAEKAEEDLLKDRLRRSADAAREEVRIRRQAAQDRHRADLAAQKKFDNDMAKLDADRRKVQLEQSKLQGGRMGQELRKALGKALLDLPTKVDIDADTRPAMEKLAKIRRDVATLRDKRIGVDIDAKAAMAELRVIEAMASRLGRRRVDIDVRTNAKGVSAILRDQINVMRAASRAASNLGDRHSQNRDRSLDAANAFRLFNVAVLLIVAALPLLVPLLAAVAGGLGALIPLALGAGAGLGVLIMGFVGLGPAVQALGDVQDNAAKDALAYTKTMRNAARGVRDAQQGLDRAHEDAARAAADSAARVADARQAIGRAEEAAARAAEDSARRVRDARQGVADATERAAEQVQSAMRRVEDSERNLARSQKASADAQRDLIAARKSAQDQLRDIALRQVGGALAERQAKLDLARAKAAWLSVSKDGSATRMEKEQALISYERSELDLESTILENKRLAEERAHSDKVGVEGSDLVVNAKERVEDALEREQDAERNLAEARRDSAKAQLDATRRLADAQERLTDAIRDQEDQQRDSAESIANARENYAKALEDQRRQELDTARSIRDATERLTDAQAAYQEALTQTGDIGSASMRKLQEAMDNLSPAGQRFARYLHSLGPQWQGLRFAAQEGVLPGAQEAVGTVMRPEFMDDYESFLFRMGDAMGELMHQATHSLIGPTWAPFFQMLDRDGIPLMESVARIMGNLVLLMGNLATAFAPFGLAFGDTLERITAGWAEWAAGLADSPGFYKFMDYVWTAGGEVSRLLVAMGDALINLGVGLAPYSSVIIGWFTDFFNLIADTDPKLIGQIAYALVTLVVALQLASGAVTFLSTASMFFARTATGGFVHPVALIILAVVALVGVLVMAYLHWEDFRDVVHRVRDALKEAGVWIWENREQLLKVVGVVVAAVSAWYLMHQGLQLARLAVLGVNIALRAMGVAMTLSMGWIALIIVSIAALVGGFIWLWNNNDTFREKMLLAWDMIKAGIAATAAWFTDTLIPWMVGAWDALWAAMVWTWENIGRPIWDVLVQIGAWAIGVFVDHLLPILGDSFAIVWGIIKFVFLLIQRNWQETVEFFDRHGDKIMGVLSLLGGFFLDFWKNGITPTFEGIAAIIEWVFDKVIKPVFSNIRKAVETLVEAFSSGESLIASIWAGLSAGLSEPIEFAIRVINKYMISPLNSLLDTVGLPWEIPKIPNDVIPTYVPKDRGLNRGSGHTAGSSTIVGRAATGSSNLLGGSVLPGYSPGVDNFRFTSPYGDILLGGGEGILRPEVVRTLGSEWVDRVNAAAMGGGVNGVRTMLGAYAGGGQVDFSKLPRKPKTDMVVPPLEPHQKSLWERFTDVAKAVKNPRKAISDVISGVAKYLPNQETFIIKYLVGGVKKLGGLVADKVMDTFSFGDPSDPAGGGGRAGEGLPWQALWRLVKAAAPEAVLTSAYRPGARTAGYGNLSMHGLGRAIDIASPNMLDTFWRVRPLLPWTELIHTPAGQGQMSNGQPFWDYNDITRRMHYDHIHLAYDKGGVVPDLYGGLGGEGGGIAGDIYSAMAAGGERLRLYDRGGMLDHRDIGLNLSGKPEAVLTNEEYRTLKEAAASLRGGGGGGGNTYQAGITTVQGATAEEIAEQMVWDMKALERANSSRSRVN